MPNARDMTPAAVAATTASEGYSVAHCVEIEFSSPVRERPSEPGRPDTEVTWDGGHITVETSLDDGATWQAVEGGKGGTIAGLKIGSEVTGLNLLVRVKFEYGSPNAVLTSLSATVILVDGTTITRTETGTDLGTGKLIACALRGTTSVAPVHQVHGYLGPTGGGASRDILANSHHPDGTKNDLHISHGALKMVFSDGNYFERQNVEKYDPTGLPEAKQRVLAQAQEAFRQAACGFEIWLKPDAGISSEMPIAVWVGESFSATPGIQLVLVPDAKGYHARLRIQSYGRALASDTNVVREVRSLVGSVQPGEWVHLAFSYNGLFSSFYQNLVLVGYQGHRFAEFNHALFATVGLAQLIGIPAGDVIPTDLQFTFADGYRGRWAEMRIWGRAITAGEISNRAHRKITASEVTVLQEDGLLAYYPPGATADTAFRDATANHYDLGRFGDAGAVADLQSWLGVEESVTTDVGVVMRRVPARIWSPLHLDAVGTQNLVRVCSAPYDITFTIDAVLKTFKGIGSYGSISAIREPGDTEPSGVEMQLSGIIPSYISAALQLNYIGRPVRIYKVQHDSTGAVVVDPWIVFEGLLDEMTMAEETGTATLTLSAESHFRNWERPSGPLWNDASHRAQFPDDFGLAEVAATAEKQIWWPENLAQADQPSPEVPLPE
jgi:hypothetical protein